MEVLNSPEAVVADFETVKKRSLVGVFSLVSRTFLIQIISFASTFLLTIFLDPKTFGIFFLVSAFISFFSYFSDIGLAAALIQKKEEISKDDLRTTFTVQQILVVILLLLIFIISPYAEKWYGLNQSAIYLFYALGFAFFLSSLKTIPSIILERHLKFNLLVIPQILETLVFNIVAVVLAWRGFGILSFVWAVLARGIVGLTAMYLIAPWDIGFSFSKESLKKLLKFGVPYQANTVMAVVKDDLMTVFLGKLIGTTGLGYLGWAKKWAEQPLRFFMDNVLKVTFPAFSRMQEDKVALRRSIEKSIFFLCFLTFPFLVGFSVLASDFVKVIPKYLKWQPAIFALYLYCFNSAWAVVSTPMTNLLNATGRIKTTFKLMIMWLGLTWILMPILGFKFGYNGVAVAAALISISSAVAIYIGKKQVGFNLFSPIFKPLACSVIMGLIVYFLKNLNISLPYQVAVRIFFGVVIYFVSSYLIIGQELIVDLKKVLVLSRKK